jgi:hypothetical protein
VDAALVAKDSKEDIAVGGRVDVTADTMGVNLMKVVHFA